MYFNMLENFVKKETELRKQFKSTDAIYLPLDTFTILKNFNLKLKCEISPEDDLDKFPKLLIFCWIPNFSIQSIKALLNISNVNNISYKEFRGGKI